MMRGDLEAQQDDTLDPVVPMRIDDRSTGDTDIPDDGPSAPHELVITPPSSSKGSSCLHKCTHCHMAFLTKAGLDQHVQQVHLPGSHPDRSSQDHRKPGRQKTIQQLLQAPYQEPPHAPLKQFECPLCQEVVGRKALLHLKRDHQATKQAAFDFVPERDMLPGSLTCSHCYSSFTMEQALITHFKRSSCPVLTCEWARKMHFGSDPASSPSGPVLTEPSLPALLHRYFDKHYPGLIGSAQTVSSLDLVDCWFPMLYEPHSCPQLHLQWFDHTAQWLAHFPELPQTRFVTDQVFHLIHALRDHQPYHWAWTLDSVDSPDIRFEQQYIHDSFKDQLSIVRRALTYIAQILARNSELQLSIWPDHGTPSWGRPIVHGSAGRLFGWLPQAPEDRHVIRWPPEEWPGAAQEELQLLCQHLGWPRRSAPDGGPSDSQAGGHFESTRPGYKPDDVPSVRKRLSDAHFARDRPSMEHSEAKWRHLDFAQTDHVPDGFSGTDQQSQQVAIDQEGRRPGHGIEGQRHPYRGQQVALPHMELRGQSTPTESEDSIDLGGHLCHFATDSPVGLESGTDPEVCGSSNSEAGQPSSGHGRHHTVATGCQPPWTGGLGTPHAAVEVGRKRHYSACADADEAIQPAEITIGHSYFPTTSQVMRGIMTTSLLNDGNSCYINSVLQAQVWTSLMTSALRPDLC